MSTKPKIYLTQAQVRKRYGNISAMGLWRWRHDARLNFPKPDLVVNDRLYWSEETLDRHDARQASKMEAA